jgi:hypothetical protein
MASGPEGVVLETVQACVAAPRSAVARRATATTLLGRSMHSGSATRAAAPVLDPLQANTVTIETTKECGEECGGSSLFKRPAPSSPNSLSGCPSPTRHRGGGEAADDSTLGGADSPDELEPANDRGQSSSSEDENDDDVLGPGE